MLTVGVTGGIGSGKSALTRLLSSYGAVVVDADRIAREVVEPGTPGLAAVVAEFGAGVLRDDGSLDRDRLGDLVFNDGAALRRLNAIVHPLVRERSAQVAAAAPAGSVVVHDVPLLVENGLGPAYDVVVVVEAPAAERLRRVAGDRGTSGGLTEDQARSRMAAQATDAERRSVADVVIVNDGRLADLEHKAADLWESLRSRAG